MESFEDFTRQRQDALLVPLAQDAQMGIGQLEIFELKGQSFTGTQTVEQHQAHQGEIAKGPKAAPELGDLMGRKRHDDAPGLPEAQTQGYGAAGPAIAERRSGRVGRLEVGLAGGNLVSIYALPFSPPQLGGRSMNLKIVSERWTDNGQRLVLTVSGRPSRDYRLELVNGDLLASVEGATREGPAGLIVHIPAGPTDEYVDHQITFALR